VTALAGLSLVVQVWTGGTLDWRGVLWGLGSAVCSAAYFLLAERTGSSTPPLVLAGVGIVAGTVLALLAGLAGVLPWGCLPGGMRSFWPASTSGGRSRRSAPPDLPVPPTVEPVSDPVEPAAPGLVINRASGLFDHAASSPEVLMVTGSGPGSGRVAAAAAR
jgi:hypothetical protein